MGIWSDPAPHFSSLKRVGREFIWVGLGQAVAVLGGIVGLRLLTEFLSPTLYGELALALTIVMLSQQLVLAPMGQSFMRFFAPMQEAGELPIFFRSALILAIQVSGILILLCLVVVLGLWAAGYSRWIPITVLAFGLSLLSGYSSSLNEIQNAARHRIVVAWHQGIDQWLRYAGAAAAILLLGSTTAMALTGFVCAAALVFASQLAFLRKLLLGNLDAGLGGNATKCIRRLKRYAWPFSGWGFFTWAQLASDRWALDAFQQTGVVGLYAALYQIGYSPITLLGMLGVQLFSPILFSWAGDASDTARLNRAYRLNLKLLLVSVGFTALGAVVAFLFHNQIFWLLVAPQYRHVSWLLPFVVLASGCFASGQIASLTFMINGNPERMLIPKIGTSVLCVLLNFAGAYVFGLTGVVLSTVIFSVAYLVWVLILARRHVRAQFRVGCQDVKCVLG